MGDELTVERSRSKTCGKGFCESNAFKIEIRRLVSKIEQKDKENAELKARIGELEKVVIIAYECGHNDTVESNYCDPEERAKEIIEENLTT